MEKLQIMVTDFVQRVEAFTSAVVQVNVANSILIHLRGLLAVILSGKGVESIATLDAKKLEAAIAGYEEIVKSVSPEERTALNEQTNAIATLVTAGLFDEDEALKASAASAVDAFRKGSVTVVAPVGKARTRAA